MDHTHVSDFCQGTPTKTYTTPTGSSSTWRGGENRTVSSLLSSPQLHHYLKDTKPTANKPTQWRQGDHHTINLGSHSLQASTLAAAAHAHAHAHTTASTNTANLFEDHGVAPLGSSQLNELVMRHQTQVKNNPRTIPVKVKSLLTRSNNLNRTLSIVGSPELQQRITTQRNSPPSPTHLKQSKSSPLLPLGSPVLQQRAADQMRQEQHRKSSGDLFQHTRAQTFSTSFVASHHASDQLYKMTWNDRNYVQEDVTQTLDYNYYPPRDTSTRIKGRLEWIAGKQMRPPQRIQQESLEWIANATRRAHDKTNREGSPTRERGEWRYKKRYFFHKAGRSMLRQAYL
jgi:hypothetical protein